VDPSPLIERILDDEGLTAGLAEPEATLLIRSLIDRVRAMACDTSDPALAARQSEALCRQAHHIALAASSVPPGESAAFLRRLLTEWPTRPG